MAASRLAKLAAVSRRLDYGMQKEAILGLAARGATALGKLMLKNPVATGVTAIGSVGAYRQNKAGFDPEVLKARLGEAPVPPGVS